jgi:hypothetical protein
VELVETQLVDQLVVVEVAPEVIKLLVMGQVLYKVVHYLHNGELTQ